MYQLLLKQRFKFAVRMVKRNIGAYLILIAIVPCILILQSMIQKNYGMDIAVFIPYGILCFLFMNLSKTIPSIGKAQNKINATLNVSTMLFPIFFTLQIYVCWQ